MSTIHGSDEIRVLSDLSSVDPADWDALHAGGHPFVRHAFLYGLETTGCLRPEWGWRPCHLTLWRGGALSAAAPGYLKANSHGEFVFDQAWARAYAQHGLDYYPKWLCAVPYSPVTGPRLLAPTGADRRALLEAAVALCMREGWSSAHVNFLPASELPAFDAEWLERVDVQYHWERRPEWRTFEDFLAAFDHKHRKNIRQERARVARAGIRFRRVHGGEASTADLDAMHGFYLRTFAEYGNHPALTRAFFGHLARTLRDRLLIVFAEREGRPIAGALFLLGDDTLYGRYWGAEEHHPGLHFETCYYQGIDYCLDAGLRRFEPGAQGEHKLARGFLPAEVRSRHWIRHPDFARALRPWCLDETQAVRRYARSARRGSPYRQTGPDTAG